MDVLRIVGGRRLEGSVEVSGSKNAALPMLVACLLTEEEVRLDNVPCLSDVKFMLEILKELGAEVSWEKDECVKVRAKHVKAVARYDLVRKMRASVCVLGALLGRLKQARVALPGGCVIGNRPIDLHLKALRQLGCAIDIKNGMVEADAKAMRSGDIFLGGLAGSTVTGTVNLLMASVLLEGTTRIHGAAAEPELADLCHLLVKMGASIRGIGSHCLEIEGVKSLHGASYRVSSDRVEAGTWLLAAAMTESELLIRHLVPSDLAVVLDKLTEIGCSWSFQEGKSAVKVRGAPARLKPINVTTLPHPGYPTDLQAQMCALASQVEGLSIITERVYPQRFMHVSELQRMGANIILEHTSAIVQGKRACLRGAPVMASDLRASAALVLAALAAEGETWVQRLYHLDRGYVDFDKKLRKVGAAVERLRENEVPSSVMF